MLTAGVVAGIPIRLRAPGHKPIALRTPAGWDDGPVGHEPLDLRYEVGDTTLPTGCTILGSGEGITCCVDPSSHIALSARYGDAVKPQLLCTVRPGYEYAVRFACERDIPITTSNWPRDAFMLAVAARGLGLMAHACGFVHPNGAGVLCPGVSGAGKSTLAALLGKASASDEPIAVLSDDRVVLTWAADRANLRLAGTPWYSAAQRGCAADVPLCAIVLVRYGGDRPAIREVRPADASRYLMRTMGLPFWDEAAMGSAVALISAAALVPAFELSYASNDSAIPILLHAIGQAIPVSA